MALKDEDFLLKNDKDLEAAMAKLGLVLNEEKKEFVDPTDQFDFDPTDQFDFDPSALEDDHDQDDQAKGKDHGRK